MAAHPKPSPRNGIPASVHHLPASCPPIPLVDYLAQQFPNVSHAAWLARLQAGAVLNTEHHPYSPQALCQPRALVWYYREPVNEPEVPFAHRVLYQSEHLVVADKPHFLPVTPGGQYAHNTLLVRLQQELNLPQLAPLHRLDRETAGLVMFSPTPGPARQAYLRLFREHALRKVYHAIAPDVPALRTPQVVRHRLVNHPSDFFRMAVAEGAPNAETHIAQIKTLEHGMALYQLTPRTGLRHQLRVQMMALGAPIVGDQFYPTVQKPAGAAEDYQHPLQLLAYSLTWTDPVSGSHHCFISPHALV